MDRIAEGVIATRRAVLVAAILICLLVCGATAWGTRETMIAPFVLPGASNIVVTTRSLSSLSIAYHAGGRPWGWRDLIAKQLVSTGWRGHDYAFAGTGAPFIVTWYTRDTVLGPLMVVENAVVGGDPNDPDAVKIESSRELHFFR